MKWILFIGLWYGFHRFFFCFLKREFVWEVGLQSGPFLWKNFFNKIFKKKEKWLISFIVVYIVGEKKIEKINPIICLD